MNISIPRRKWVDRSYFYRDIFLQELACFFQRLPLLSVSVTPSVIYWWYIACLLVIPFICQMFLCSKYGDTIKSGLGNQCSSSSHISSFCRFVYLWMYCSLVESESCVSPCYIRIGVPNIGCCLFDVWSHCAILLRQSFSKM